MTDRNAEPFDAPPRDDTLDPLLDRVLGADSPRTAPPSDLVDRIMQSTTKQIEARGTGVLARINPAVVRAFAASVILTVTVGFMAGAYLVVQDAETIVTVKSSWNDLARIEPRVEPIDEELDVLATNIAVAQSDSDWDAARSSIEQQITDLELRISDPAGDNLF